MPPNEVQHHIGSVIGFENLVDAHDIWVVELRQATRLAHKHVHQRIEFTDAAAVLGAHGLVGAMAQRFRETLLDNDAAAQTVGCKIGDPEATAAKVRVNLVLPVQQCGPRWQGPEVSVELVVHKMLGHGAPAPVKGSLHAVGGTRLMLDSGESCD